MSEVRLISRRSMLPLLAAPLVAGCGFQPVYAPAAGQADSAAASGLAEINVGLIPERTGQLLRNALQERFERSGVAVARRYDLAVAYQFSAEAIGIQQDYSSSRLRFIGLANFTFTAQDPSRTTLTSGVARSADGVNMFDNQFFAADQETEMVQRRIAEALADQIALQLAIYFHKRPAAAAG